MKHSPTPWTFCKGNGVMFIRGQRAPGMPYDLAVGEEDYTGYGDEEQREADLRLMAEAPAMLALLKLAVREPLPSKLTRAMLDAIKRAEVPSTPTKPVPPPVQDDPYERLLLNIKREDKKEGDPA